MRVLHLYRDFYASGGVPGQVRRLADAQVALGAEVFALADTRDGSSSSGDSDIQRASRADLSDSVWDAVHVHGVLIPRDLAVSFSAPRARTWVSPHGVLNPLGLNVRFGGGRHGALRRFAKHGLIETAARAVMRRGAGVIAEAPYEAEILERFGPRETCVVPMGNDDDWLRSRLIRRGGRPNRVTYLGRLDVFHKGLDLLLDACRELQDRGRELPQVRIVGSDSQGSVDWLERRVRELGLPNVAIEPPMWGVEKRQLLEETDWFWGVFRYAGMARACGEAVSAGVPLIASREGNWGDWVAQSGGGIVSGLDGHSCLENLSQAISTPMDAYETYSRCASEFGHANSWRRSAESMLDVYAGSSAPR